MEFRERLASLLAQHGWSHGDLAAATGISRNYISKILRGERQDPGLSKVAAMARALNVSLDWLATGETREPLSLEPDEEALVGYYRRIDTEAIRAFILQAARDGAQLAVAE